MPYKKISPKHSQGIRLPPKIQTSVQYSHSVMSDSSRPHESQHARPPCPSPTPRIYSNPCPSSQWCHPAISSSVVPFSSCPQSLPESGSFQMSQLLASGGQSVGVSASASVLPMNTQDWSPLGWTDWISLQSKGLSRVFSSSIVQKLSIKRKSSPENRIIYTIQASKKKLYPASMVCISSLWANVPVQMYILLFILLML